MEHHQCSYLNKKENIKVRLSRIEGQIKGIEKMIEEGKYCVDVLNQIAAVRAALKKVGLIILREHTKGCVLNSKGTRKEEEKINELMELIEKFLK
ncbi:metal-sensitive transcriptional regulator [Thermovenabulum gondwanense]|uniref:Copper-sensing transcriptional repressor CsoR n=1 Tax=Thermovenabulum gondwanense TaxID=520767 RepID=A0A161PSH2_9FIRM|nr:metal-sensitive transcriptional regulator [Thermovenabulum gondwanense]KYO63957.1 Copper-sensing transcriptional repressor CsoR [Thermovenabulum gondwanense]